ncbi:hypothetical protein HD554DRAFT_2041680 [Boletus coccyginus]|nr:hypothetical protein HD554DRAFT_2041680 [Boletus coccyginus]
MTGHSGCTCLSQSCQCLDGQGRSVDPGQRILRNLFGLDATELSEPHTELIRELKKAVQKGSVQVCTTATLTILKLCKTTIIHAYLCDINLLDIFCTTCCIHIGHLSETYMLPLDYFNDAIGQVKGFQIFGDFMQHDNESPLSFSRIWLRILIHELADLWEKIKNYNITEVLNTKLGKGKPREIHTSLICLDIFRSFDKDGPWTHELIAKSLKCLQMPAWKAQKAGVTILFALAQTEHSVAGISLRIYEIIEMLLPEGYLHIQPQAGPAGPTFTNKGHTQPAAMTTEFTDTRLQTEMIKAIDEELSEEGLMSIRDPMLPHIQHWNRLITLLHDRAVWTVTILPVLLGVSTLAILAMVVLTPIYLSTQILQMAAVTLSGYPYLEWSV